MNAEPAAQLALLDLQAADTAIRQLAHRRANLPEVAELAGLDQQLRAQRDEVVGLQTQASDLDREQRRVDRDVEQVRARAERDRNRMSSGAALAKELESMQHEVGTLARRQAELEDAELEVMQRREDIERRLDAVQSEIAAAEDRALEAAGRRDEATVELDRAEAERASERAAAVRLIPAELVALYERVRDQSGGVGAAMLRARRCEGCRLDLAPSELAAVRNAAPSEVLRCEQCRRILVRTAESGL